MNYYILLEETGNPFGAGGTVILSAESISEMAEKLIDRMDVLFDIYPEDGDETAGIQYLQKCVENGEISEEDITGYHNEVGEFLFQTLCEGKDSEGLQAILDYIQEALAEGTISYWNHTNEDVISAFHKKRLNIEEHQTERTAFEEAIAELNDELYCYF
jgi:hypothetical protein